MTDIEFYRLVSKTNPDYVKRASLGGRNVATVDPQYQTELATEQWGLYGKEWGIKDICFTTKEYDDVTVMALYGVFWYPSGEFPYAVSEKAAYVTSKGRKMVDVDIEKKLLTKFQSKCLSKVGFNADVFLGMFDDAEYVQEVHKEFHKINSTQLQLVMDLILETETDKEKFCEAFGIRKIADLAEVDFNKAVAMLKKKKEKA